MSRPPMSKLGHRERDRVGFDRYVGIQLLQTFRVLPVRGGTPAGQQSGGSQQKCSRAD